MRMVRRSQALVNAEIHFVDGKKVHVHEFHEPVSVRLSSWYERAALEAPYGREGGKPGFMIVPAPPNCSPDGLTETVITNLDAQVLFVNAGLYYIPFACTIYYCWPDVEPGRNNGTARFELQTAEPFTSPEQFCFAHFLTNNQVMTVPREVQSVSCPYLFAALNLDGVGAPVKFGERPTPIGGTRTLQMVFLPGIPAAIARVPVTLYY